MRQVCAQLAWTPTLASRNTVAACEPSIMCQRPARWLGRDHSDPCDASGEQPGHAAPLTTRNRSEKATGWMPTADSRGTNWYTQIVTMLQK